jgi:UDP-3-O-[3-hydroxymyristoyl] glucosamine N-acyltransferase
LVVYYLKSIFAPLKIKWMKFTAEEIANFLNGEIIGNPSTTVSSISRIEEAKEGSLAFLSNLKYENYLYTSEASIILVNQDFTPRHAFTATLIKVKDSYQCFASLLELYAKTTAIEKRGIEQPSFVDETAVLGEDVYFGAFSYAGKNVKIGKRVKIYPQVYVGDNVHIGDDSVVYAGVKIYNDSQIGCRCIIHSGVVIGSDGFGFAPQSNGSYKKIPQLGIVVLEDDVEIGANTTIDCGTMDFTTIRKGVKLDNLIMVGHNCEIGENSVVAALTGFAGSTKIGRNCRLGGQVGFAGHLKVGDNVQIGAQSGVTKNIRSNENVLGSPAMDFKHSIRTYTIMRNLPQLRQEVIDLRKEINSLKEIIGKKSE